jgi:hypothetical protein
MTFEATEPSSRPYATKATRSHHGVPNVFLTNYLGDCFRRLSSSDDCLKAQAGRFRFSYRILRALAAACEAVASRFPLLSRLHLWR